jgi:hypothetical protein
MMQEPLLKSCRSNLYSIVIVPNNTIIVQDDGSLKTAWEVGRRNRHGEIEVVVPNMTIFRIKVRDKIRYYVVDNCRIVRLKGTRGKIPCVGTVTFYRIPRGDFVFAIKYIENRGAVYLMKKDIERSFRECKQ